MKQQLSQLRYFLSQMKDTDPNRQVMQMQIDKMINKVKKAKSKDKAEKNKDTFVDPDTVQRIWDAENLTPVEEDQLESEDKTIETGLNVKPKQTRKRKIKE